MRSSLIAWKFAPVALMAAAMYGGTFGTVVPIGGQASDVALDPTRNVLYIANFTGNQIDIMQLGTNALQSSIPVVGPPNSLAVSPDGHYLLATNYGNFASPQSPSNALTIVDLATRAVQTLALADSPLGVAFGLDGKALIVTATTFLLFDPLAGTIQQIGTIDGLVNQTLPVPPANFPPSIANASIAVSGDGLTIYGMGGSTSTFTFRYEVNGKALSPGGIVLSSGTLGPRVVSVNQDGTRFLAGWILLDNQGTFLSFFAPQANQAAVGTTAFDSARGLIYAQIPGVAGEAPAFLIANQDNLNVLQRLQLPENLAGKSVLSSDGNTLYSVSESGVMVLPVGDLSAQPRVLASRQDLQFQEQICGPQVVTQPLSIVDPGGGNTAFSISSGTPGIAINPSSGVTPATVQVTVDPTLFQGQNGTATASLQVTSQQAVNRPQPVRLLVNGRQPNQRGLIVDVPGTLVDIAADPARNRFYILRQDTDQVLVFDGATYSQLATLETGNVPTGMAVTFDMRYLLVANEQAQTVSVFDLETLKATSPIRMPNGYSAISVASSARRILASALYYDGTYHIVSLDLPTRSGSALPSLGVFQNTINKDTVLAASPNGSSILIAEADGSTMLYDANQDTFVASRKDFTSLSGAYAASNYHQYAAGSNLLDASLVPAGQLDTASGTSSGFAFVDQVAFRSTVPGLITASTGSSGSGGSTTTPPTPTTSTPSSAPGVAERLNLTNAGNPVASATQLAEAPLLGNTSSIFPSVFTRTLAPLANRQAIISLSVSGFTVLPWNYDAATAPPQISSVVNAADDTPGIAPGGLVSIFGQNLSPVNDATSQIPIPTAVAGSCLTVNGLAMPVLFVSPSQINAQMPFEAVGDVTLILHTPGGVSGNYNLQILPGAPGVFRTGSAGPVTNIPAVIRNANGKLVTASDPVHIGDVLIIYLTGLGATFPPVSTGQPAPSHPLAQTLNAPQVTLGGASLPVLFSGLAPGEVGVYQINVAIPRGVPQGLTIPLSIGQAGYSTTVNVRVIN